MPCNLLGELEIDEIEKRLNRVPMAVVPLRPSSNLVCLIPPRSRVDLVGLS